MYSKQEATRIRQTFWTSFGQYMQPVPPAGGEKVSWSNYKTGIKHIAFRLQADRGFASVAIELSNPDPLVREQQFEQLMQLKNMFPSPENWTWLLHTTDEMGRPISRIYRELNNVNIFTEQDWPTIISFLKQQIVMLDGFWNDVKIAFE